MATILQVFVEKVRIFKTARKTRPFTPSIRPFTAKKRVSPGRSPAAPKGSIFECLFTSGIRTFSAQFRRHPIFPNFYDQVSKKTKIPKQEICPKWKWPQIIVKPSWVLAIFRQNSEKSAIARNQKNLQKRKKWEKTRGLVQNQNGYNPAGFCGASEDF